MIATNRHARPSSTRPAAPVTSTSHLIGLYDPPQDDDRTSRPRVAKRVDAHQPPNLPAPPRPPPPRPPPNPPAPPVAVPEALVEPTTVTVGSITTSPALSPLKICVSELPTRPWSPRDRRLPFWSSRQSRPCGRRDRCARDVQHVRRGLIDDAHVGGHAVLDRRRRLINVCLVVGHHVADDRRRERDAATRPAPRYLEERQGDRDRLTDRDLRSIRLGEARAISSSPSELIVNRSIPKTTMQSSSPGRWIRLRHRRRRAAVEWRRSGGATDVELRRSPSHQPRHSWPSRSRRTAPQSRLAERSSSDATVASSRRRSPYRLRSSPPQRGTGRDRRVRLQQALLRGRNRRS